MRTVAREKQPIMLTSCASSTRRLSRTCPEASTEERIYYFIGEINAINDWLTVNFRHKCIRVLPWNSGCTLSSIIVETGINAVLNAIYAMLWHTCGMYTCSACVCLATPQVAAKG